MARGIERRKLFRDDKDRKSFLERLAIILEETQTQCYAWALIPNHFHLLLRTGLSASADASGCRAGPTPLSKVMRRLMTGYAVTFNKRHKRSGHLFQNRYKSVVCEENSYLLELIRYIHLNPLRAGIVKDLKVLDKYPWTGHSTILGRHKNPLLPKEPDKPNKLKQPNKPKNPEKPLAEKTIEDVLLHFGDTLNVARRRYRQFVKNGIEQGKRPELQGGGLVRSAGGNKSGLLGRKKEEREKGDARILGSGDFVSEVLREAGEIFESLIKKRMSLEEIIDAVAQYMGVSIEEIKSSSRKRKLSYARSVVAYAAIRNMGYKGTEVAKILSLSPGTVSQNIDKGKILIDKHKELKVKLQTT
ncbi:MAG: helix-turn-helix domain-containing protein [Thermodesulfobacteriota bacterium]|nr:helix-turn-helix domain-containing protein [Thermodesulfobacteriota bacterium]